MIFDNVYGHLRKFQSKIFRPTEIQIQILNDSQSFPTFWHMFLIQQGLFFHTGYLRALGSLRVERNYEITIFLGQNHNLQVEK